MREGCGQGCRAISDYTVEVLMVLGACGACRTGQSHLAMAASVRCL
jgi:hypothetical protein